MGIIKRILSWLFGIGVWVRNLLFDEHLFYVYKPSIPTICVGNLAVGGTGKTPHVEYIISLLARAGYRVAVLSRGYKRKTKGFVMADANATADTIGDEARQIQMRFPEVTVAVCENRHRGIRNIMKLRQDTDIIILDDAFQHRQVRCGLNILLTPFDRLYVHDHLLPYGRLREPAHGSVRADVIVVTKCPEGMKPIDRRVIMNHLQPAPFQELTFSHIVYHAELPEKLYLFAGIAQPQYLQSYLGERVQASLLFPDHHAYTTADIAKIAETFMNDYPIFTTAKDYVKLVDNNLITGDLCSRIQMLPISVEFQEDTETFNRIVLRYAKEHKRKS